MLASRDADDGSSPMRHSPVRRFAAAVGAAVVAAAVVAVTASAPAVGQPGGFGDVAEDAYYSVPVSTLAERGVFVGTECQAGFCPGDPIDRKTMAVWVVRVLDGEDPEAVSETRFDDVDASGFYAPFIERMAELEVTRGCGDGTGFCPDRNVTRAQMAVFLSRAYKLPEGPDQGFADVPADALYAADVARLAASKITVGCGDGTGFCPGRDTTRDQMAVFLYRAEQRSEPGDTTGSDAAVPLGDYDRQRLLAAANTLDPDAECPPVAVPESLQDMAEVLRIDGGCLIIDYVPLGGRTIEEAREEILAEDPTAHAVGVAPTALQIDALQVPPHDQPPPPYDEDDYNAGEWWHLDRLGAADLWSPDGWEYPSGSGNLRRIPGWGDSEVIVAVIDTGTAEHPDLHSNLVRSGDVDAFDWFDDDCHIDDRHGHGTSVAGLVAAIQGNGQDVAGIAPKAQILPINLLGWQGNWTDGVCRQPAPGSGKLTLTTAVQQAWLRGADVINMSFVITSSAAGGYDSFEAALDIARSFGIVAVASAGNCGDESRFNSDVNYRDRCGDTLNVGYYPAALNSSVLAVAAIAQDGTAAVFSTQNENVDIAAPGDGDTPYSGIATTTLDNTRRKAGTSMAAPLVSGIVAHMKARYPQATPDQIIQALLDTSTNPSGTRTDDLGHGIIEPKAAIEALDQMTRFSAVSVGSSHACGLRANGQITCWGSNRFGAADAPAGSFSAVSVGGLHSCGLRANGQITCWGSNRFGAADAPAGSFSAVFAGGRHACGLRTNGEIECWGEPFTHDLEEVPGGSFIEVSFGFLQACGLRTNGEIECWGEPLYHDLEDAPAGSFRAVSVGPSPDDYNCGVRTAGEIECWGESSSSWMDAPAVSFNTVSVGGEFSCGLRTNGEIECWGASIFTWIYAHDRLDAPDGSFIEVSVGYSHACGLRANGEIECWGEPLYHEDAPGGSFSAVSAGDRHSCGLRTDGTVECWGDPLYGGPSYGQADPPSGSFRALSSGTAPCGVRTNGEIECWGDSFFGRTAAPAGSFISVSSGATHSCGLRADGRITCWGIPLYGRADPPSGTFSAMSVGLYHSCAVRTDGEITCWPGRTGESDPPNGSFSTVSAGHRHSCGLHTNGAVECWGDNDYGQTDAPAGLFSTVSAGDRHSCGLRTDGAVECWGDNDYGQTDAPAGLFSTVSAGDRHSCGLRTDGTVECWGPPTVAPPDSLRIRPPVWLGWPWCCRTP